MKVSERDDLLVRLDERTQNAWRVMEEVRDHIKEQNGKIDDLIQCANRNRVWITVFRWMIYIGVPTAIGTKLGGFW